MRYSLSHLSIFIGLIYITMFATRVKEIHYSLMTYLIYMQKYESLRFANKAHTYKSLPEFIKNLQPIAYVSNEVTTSKPL